MRHPIRSACFLLLLPLILGACKKYTDTPGQYDPRLERPYCNDPEAVNFNRGFPGRADNSVCYYPADAFEGSYRFEDSIYDGTQKLLSVQSINFNITGKDRIRFDLNGFCPAGSPSIAFTANRALRAEADTNALKGQLLCRSLDTVSGFLTMPLFDSSSIRFSLIVISDTGTVYHQGTAYRQ